jgi:hypothetical protein
MADTRPRRSDPLTRLAVDLSPRVLDWRPTSDLHHRAEAPSQHRLRSPVVIEADSASGAVRLDTELGCTARLEDPSVGNHGADDGVSPLVGDAFPYVHAGQRSALRHVSGSGIELMHSVQARGEVRPDLRPTLREIDHRGHHLRGRVAHIELEAELGPADTVSSGPESSTPQAETGAVGFLSEIASFRGAARSEARTRAAWPSVARPLIN